MNMNRFAAGTARAFQARPGLMAAAAALSLVSCLAGPWVVAKFDPPSKAPESRVAIARPLAPLPVEVAPGDSRMSLARKLARKDVFLALALGVEDLPSRAYVDAAGANVGAGYCVEARRRARGLPGVWEDLLAAGFEASEITDLTSRDKARVESVKVSPQQGLRLLALTKARYAGMAREALGEKAYARLAPHKRDVLAYLAYNTGNPASFVKLMKAARARDDEFALRQLAPAVRSGGKIWRNHRLRAWAQAAWVGPEALAAALDHPVLFESAYAHQAGQDKFVAAPFSFARDKLDKQRLSRLELEKAQLSLKPAKPAPKGKA